MKTLYINISGKSIQNSEDIIVVGTPDDAIVDKFYYELGKEIVKGVDAPGIRGLAKHVVKSFKDIDELSFDKITMQWLKVKDKLLGENPTGSETIELPMEYVKWLQNYGDTSHTEIAKSLCARNCLVEISLDKIYRNSVNIIINSIESDNYGQFVVNDEAVTDDSAISIAIMKKFDGIAFKPYKKEDVCQKCGKNPCECPKVCPKCGKSPCECKQNHVFAVANYTILYGMNNFIFQLYDISGHLIDNRHFLRIFPDDEFGKDRSIHYGYYNCFIPNAATSGLAHKIRPLLGFCIEDKYLYIITRESITKICEYSQNKSFVQIFNKFIIVTEGERFVVNKSWRVIRVYEIKGKQVIIRAENIKVFSDEFKEWIFNQDKYNYMQDHDHIWPQAIDSKEIIVFNGYKSANYLGTNTDGQDLFVVEPENGFVNKKWPIMTKDANVVYNIYYDGIKDLSKDRKYIIVSNPTDLNVGITSIDGKMIVGEQYLNIEEIEDGTFKLDSRKGDTEYYSVKNNVYYRSMFKDFIWNGNALSSLLSKEIVVSDCKLCSYIMSDLYHYLDFNNKGWIINKKGKKLLEVDAIMDDGVLIAFVQKYRKDTQNIIVMHNNKLFVIDVHGNYTEIKYNMYKSFVYGVALCLSKSENSIKYCKTDGSVHNIPWHNKKEVIDVEMFSEDTLLVKMTNRDHSMEYEILLSLDGKEILEQKHHGSYKELIKLSEEYFTCVDCNGKCGVYDMKGNVIMKPACNKIVLV